MRNNFRFNNWEIFLLFFRNSSQRIFLHGVFPFKQNQLICTFHFIIIWFNQYLFSATSENWIEFVIKEPFQVCLQLVLEWVSEPISKTLKSGQCTSFSTTNTSYSSQKLESDLKDKIWKQVWPEYINNISIIWEKQKSRKLCNELIDSPTPVSNLCQLFFHRCN